MLFNLGFRLALDNYTMKSGVADVGVGVLNIL